MEVRGSAGVRTLRHVLAKVLALRQKAMAQFAQRLRSPPLPAGRRGLLEALAPDDCPEALAVLAVSDFVAARAQVDGDWFKGYARQRAWEKAPGRAEIEAALGEALAGAGRAADLSSPMRTLRHRLMVGCVCRHVLGLADFHATATFCSDMADAFIDAALDRLYGWAVERHGAPLDEQGAPQRLVVMALGKLGGGELNLSSDVDLLFAYPRAGQTANGQRNQQFFQTLAQDLVRVLDTPTGEGRAFRVDTRLRPYGESGPLAWSFDALETYYADQGRDWERYALVRMRPCAGDMDAGKALLTALEPFVYRRYLDFGAIAALREMKRRVDSERRGGTIERNVKLGPGGIREVEFLTHARQLIWGGRRRELRCPRPLDALGELGRLGVLEAEAADRLAEAYVYLRNVEHGLQAIADEQTHELPEDATDQERLAWMMNVADYDGFMEALNQRRHLVSREFEATLEDHGPVPEGDAHALWRGDVEAPAALRSWVERLRRGRDKPSVARAGRERLDRLMPLLLDRLQRQPADAALALERVGPILEAVLRRSAYLALLIENPAALDALIHLAAQSKWIAAEVARHPVLFDELLLPSELDGPPERASLSAELGRSLARGALNDPERALDVLREFKGAHLFRAAAAEIGGRLPLMGVSDYLTHLAEAVLDGALSHVWREAFGSGPVRDFAVVGYGKLGGFELGPASDLDLVFLHDFPTVRHGELHRLVRRFLNALTATTTRGTLYEIDMRLRPSGRAGAMVSAIGGFRRYQQEEAWTWERQALVRARAVAGDVALRKRFEETRRAALAAPRDRAALKTDVLAMRQRIADAAAADADLKRAPGGIVDVEFIVQFLVLAWASEHPALCDFTDNVRILETAAQLGLVEAKDASALTEAYLALRSEGHRAALDLPDPARAASLLASHRDDIRSVWRRVFET